MSLFSKIEYACGAILLAIITVLVFIASVARFLNHPIIWSVDLAQLLFIWLCFIGATRALRKRAHLGVDLFVRRLGHNHRLFIEMALALIFIALLSVLAVEGYQLALQNKERIFGDSGISYFYVTIAVTVGSVFLILAIISNCIDAWKTRSLEQHLIFSKSEDPLQE